MRTRILLNLFTLAVIVSCNNNNCDFIHKTQPYNDWSQFKSIPVQGIYKVSALSTDNSFNSKELVKTRLYLISDSTIADGLKGEFIFTDYPAWDNASSKNKLEDFLGAWSVVVQPGGVFSSDRFFISPFYVADFEKVSAKSMIGNLDVRLMNGQPIIVVRVFQNLNRTEAKFGYSLIYPTSESTDYCNYLVFEKESSTISDSTKISVSSYLNSFGM